MRFETVSDVGEQFAILGIGSNLDPEEQILQAVPALRARVRVVQASRFYRGPAYHPLSPAQPLPPFINGVFGVRTSLSPAELKFGVLRQIEEVFGRRRTADRFAPRVLDLDLLIYGAARMESAELVLPDPEVFLRPYWALPVSELMPDFPEPTTGVPLRRLVEQMDSKSLVFEEALTLAVRKAIGGGTAGIDGRPGAARDRVPR
jgi:2-amino-4-hydroxy-6-hydroxymethyldihydropteridine diphosphokinase